MAKRSRKHRNQIPGYHESRPSREERRQEHRRVRHAAHQMLHMVDDPEEVVALPEVRRSRQPDALPVADVPSKNRFRVWKTKFWKRRDRYQDMKAQLDSNWPVITSEQLRHDQP
ncbi:MAG TPA: hypothetical protein VMO52_08915 [Acidimicrobiia bacterium]|jgi:hypothetical protein|nr:hypothetical protein [Acidimicrobiia bacterium]